MAKDMSPEAKAKRLQAQRDRRARKKEAASNVTELFGEPGARNDPDDVLPGGQHGPRPAHRKTRPRQKMRLSPNMTEVMTDIREGRTTMREVVQAMDPEELVRGRFKATDGTFKGRPPAMVPAEFHSECLRELLKRGTQLYRDSFLKAIEIFVEIAADPMVEPAQRLKAAQYIWERVEGKVPERVEVAAVQPWESIIDGIVAEAEDEQIARASRLLSGGEV